MRVRVGGRCRGAVPRAGGIHTKVADTFLPCLPGLVACACVSDRKRTTRVRVWRDSATVAPGALSKPEQCAAWLAHLGRRDSSVPLAEIAPRAEIAEYTCKGHLWVSHQSVYTSK